MVAESALVFQTKFFTPNKYYTQYLYFKQNLLYDSNFDLNFFIILFYINYKCFVPSCASDKQSHIKRHFFRLYLIQDF